jgi:hypothetical protein
MLCLPLSFGKGEIVAAVHCRQNLSPLFTGRCQRLHGVRRLSARHHAAIASGETAPLKRDDIGMNRHRALAYCLSMIFSENRFTLFQSML